MSKFINHLKPLWKKYIERRVESGNANGEHFNNVIKVRTQDYIGKMLLTVIFISVLLMKWKPSTENDNIEVLQLITPVVMILFIITGNTIAFIIVLIMGFIKKYDNCINKTAIWIDDYILCPVSKELDNNAFGFILANIIMLLAIYNRNWQALMVNWQTTPKSHSIFIYQLFIFILVTIVLPFISCWFNTLVSGFINVLKNNRN